MRTAYSVRADDLPSYVRPPARLGRVRLPVWVDVLLVAA
jgi:hypothetical protein